MVDGLTYYRDKNTVTDLVSGVTLDLKATSPTAVTVKIQPDADAAVEQIKSFIAKYNDVLDYLAQNTGVDTQAGTRGILSLDSTFSTLALELKRRAATIVGSQTAGDPNSLAALGVRAARDGKLSISDETALRNTFATDPEAVQRLFNAADGVATTLEAFVDGYTDASGRIALTQSSITTRINGLNNQIRRMEDTLARKQARLEDQLSRNQALLIQLSRQQAQINAFISGQF